MVVHASVRKELIFRYPAGKIQISGMKTILCPSSDLKQISPAVSDLQWEQRNLTFYNFSIDMNLADNAWNQTVFKIQH